MPRGERSEHRQRERRRERSPAAPPRRAFLAFVGASLVAPSLRAVAQRRAYRIGLLESVPASQNAANLAALRRGLHERGYDEDRNLVIAYRSADGHSERFRDLARDLVAADVDLIVARGTPAARAASEATRSLPVVMATMGDAHPMVVSFAHPGGNVTGLTTYSTELSAKRVELLKELVPKLSRVGLLHDMGNEAAHAEWDETRKACAALGLDAALLDVREATALDRALAQAHTAHVDGLVVGADGLTQMHRRAIVDLAVRARLPTCCPARDFVEDGGLFAYAPDYAALYERLASYIDRILKGARPGDLPIEQPARFELVVNTATAAKLGIALSPQLRLRADALIA